ncbi:LysR substrate-binding domain-containing protein [soil metagenome]
MTSQSSRPPIAGRVDRLRVRHLKLLALIGASGSLTAAAAELQVSQPSATKLLQDLEEAFGHSLVDRTTRGGVLSVAGERAVERLKIATGALDAMGDALAVDAGTPLVRIGMLPLAGVSLVPRLVAALAARNELPRMRLRDGPVSEVMRLLREGHYDCVIGRVDSDSLEHHAGTLDVVPLVDEHFEVACGSGHPLARKRKLDLRQLHGERWILPDRGTYTRRVFDAAYVSIGSTPPPAHIESPSFHVSLATVAQSPLLTIAPRSAVAFYASRGHVHKLSLAQPFQPDYAVFVTLRNAVRFPAVELIRRELQAQCMKATRLSAS